MNRLARQVMMSAAIAALVAASALPASAIAIRKENRAEGDPTAQTRSHASEAPADTSGPRYFDKQHSGAN